MPESPHGIYVPFALFVLELQEDAVWRVRNAVRMIEVGRTSLHSPLSSSELHFCHLHDLARHAIHVSETLDLAALILHSMAESQRTFGTRTASSSEVELDNAREGRSEILKAAHRDQKVRARLRFFQDAIKALRLRSNANKDRLDNEMHYSSNVVAQGIARASYEIQNAVQLDSSIMRIVTLATAAFIPMTFIATVFGMQFFAYSVEKDTWKTSNKFWIFPITAIPLTVVMALALYQYYRVNIL